MENKPKQKWYFSTYFLIIAFLCVGPFALPLVWLNPRFSTKVKIIISVITIILTYYTGMLFFNSLKSLINYYKLIFGGFDRLEKL
jgi:hypothetical protein